MSEPEPRRAMTGLGVGEEGLVLMLDILRRQEENECKQIEARYRRMRQRINRVGVLMKVTALTHFAFFVWL